MSSDLAEPLVGSDALPAMLPAGRTAMVIIDVQEDFLSPDGPAGCWGVDLAALAAPLARIERLIDAARTQDVPLVFVRVVTRAETDSDALKLLHARKGLPAQSVALCRAGTQGAGYYRIQPRRGDIEIEKTLYSSFAGTDLEDQLKARGIDTLVITGFTTDCCVDCTARDAFHRNFSVFLVTDACAAYEETLHVGALNGLAKNCALLTDTEALLAAWG